ncbi:hypothetical protein RUND412_002487 [Rhizina undulata]
MDINSRNEDGRTPLWIAAYEGHEAILKLFLEKEGVDINCRNKNGRTPLFVAAFKGHKAAVKLLLENEVVDINSEDDYGQTPLNVAHSFGHRTAFKRSGNLIFALVGKVKSVESTKLWLSKILKTTPRKVSLTTGHAKTRKTTSASFERCDPRLMYRYGETYN